MNTGTSASRDRDIQVEILDVLDDATAASPVEDLLTLGNHGARALTVRRWSSAGLILVLGFGLGRIPWGVSRPATTQLPAANAGASHSSAASTISYSAATTWGSPAADAGYACLRDTGGAGGQCNTAMGIHDPKPPAPARDGGYACLRDTGGAAGQCNTAMGIIGPRHRVPAGATAKSNVPKPRQIHHRTRRIGRRRQRQLRSDPHHPSLLSAAARSGSGPAAD